MRFGSDTTRKWLENERERRREEDGRGWRRKEGKGGGKMGKNEEKMKKIHTYEVKSWSFLERLSDRLF